MTDNISIQKTKAKAIGVGDGRGFTGRYMITSLSVEDLGENRWCKGTSYSIYPFKSTQEEFLGAALSLIARGTPSDIFSNMRNIMRKSFYIPMIVLDDNLICLNGEIPAIVYDFFNNGTCLHSKLSPVLGTLEPFDPYSIDRTKVEFLSIWLSLADVNYMANLINTHFDKDEKHKVVFVPVHYFSFDYNEHHYTAMSYGDKTLSNLICNDLPLDDIITGQQLLIQKPWISIILLSIWIFGIVGLTFAFYVYMVISLKQRELIIRVIGLAIPVAIIYVLAWIMMRVFAKLFRHTLLKIETLSSYLCQWFIIRQNYSRKRHDLSRLFNGIDVRLPRISDIKIDTSPIKQFYNNFLDSLVIKKNAKFLEKT